MNVLHVYRTYFPDTQGGLEEAIRQICRGIHARGHVNRIFTLSRNPTPKVIEYPEADVFRFPLHAEVASCSLSMGCAAGFRELVAWADIIHYHFPWPFADVLHCITGVTKPALLTYHSDIIRQNGILLRLYSPLMHRFLRQMDAIVATSPNYAATSAVLAQYQHKLQVIPLGLDLNIEENVAQPERAMREQYGEGYFVFIGVLRYYKGLDVLLDAAEDAPYTMIIAGTGPLEEQLRIQKRQRGLDNVVFTGFVSDGAKIALLRQARAVVFPSYLRSEAFGMTLLEGAACGKPLITAEIGSGMSYINQHNETGLIVPPKDADALRQAMDRLYYDPVLANALGQGAYQRYQKIFTADKMAHDYLALYQAIAIKKQRTPERLSA